MLSGDDGLSCGPGTSDTDGGESAVDSSGAVAEGAGVTDSASGGSGDDTSGSGGGGDGSGGSGDDASSGGGGSVADSSGSSGDTDVSDGLGHSNGLDVGVGPLLNDGSLDDVLDLKILTTFNHHVGFCSVHSSWHLEKEKELAHVVHLLVHFFWLFAKEK